jgi:hypothetical protein
MWHPAGASCVILGRPSPPHPILMGYPRTSLGRIGRIGRPRPWRPRSACRPPSALSTSLSPVDLPRPCQPPSALSSASVGPSVSALSKDELYCKTTEIGKKCFCPQTGRHESPGAENFRKWRSTRCGAVPTSQRRSGQVAPTSPGPGTAISWKQRSLIAPRVRCTN